MSIRPASTVRLIYLFLLVLACDSSGCGKTGGEADISFTTLLFERSWTVEVGPEAFKCSGLVADQDLYIKGFRTTTVAGLTRMTVTVSDTIFTTGDSDCGPADGYLRAKKTNRPCFCPAFCPALSDPLPAALA